MVNQTLLVMATRGSLELVQTEFVDCSGASEEEGERDEEYRVHDTIQFSSVNRCYYECLAKKNVQCVNRQNKDDYAIVSCAFIIHTL